MRTAALCCLLLLAACGQEIPAPFLARAPERRPARSVAVEPDAARGRTAYRHRCAACHGLEGRGDGPNAAHLGRPVPPLDRLAGNADGLLARLQEDPGKRMHVERDDRLRDIAAYLARGLQREPPECRLRLSGADQPGCDACHHRPGQTMLQQANCAGCHELPGQTRRAVGPSLTGIGSRFQPAFLRRFLRRPYNRRQIGYLPMQMTRMPDFDLSEQQAADLAALLEGSRVTLPAAPPPDPTLVALGRSLVDERGCLDCHRLGKRGGRFGPDLTSVGARLQWPYLVAWLRDPQALSPDTPMPRPGLDPRQTLAVASFLDTQRAPTIDDDAGRTTLRGRPGHGMRLLRELRCAGCHELAGHRPPQPGIPLVLEGLRADPDWLYEFLDRPHRIRRDDAGRMPRFRFTAPERMALVDALQQMAHARWPDPPPAPSTDAVAGKRLYRAQDCARCHGPRGKAVALPDRRLRRGWVRRFLADPPRYLPAQSAHPRLAPGPAARVEAYLMRERGGRR